MPASLAVDTPARSNAPPTPSNDAAATPGKTSSAPDDATLQAQLQKHAGATVDDGGHYVWRIESDGSFTCTQQPTTATRKSVGAKITLEAAPGPWHKLTANALKALEPVPAATPAPAAQPSQDAPTTPAAPAPAASTGFSLEGFLRSMFEGVTSLFNIGDQVQAPVADVTPVPTPEPKTPGSPEEGAPAPQPTVPGQADVHAMSQFVWYGASFEDLKATDIVAACKVLHEAFGLGQPSALTPKPAPADKAIQNKNPNHGYWWFKPDGGLTWDGNYSATQYMFNPMPFERKVNDVSLYLASNPPGKRPQYMRPRGGGLEFGTTGGDGWTDVPAAAIALKLRNIPGGECCFATSEAMMAQAGVTAATNGTADVIDDIVTSETYYDVPYRGSKMVKDVTINAASSFKAKTYLDWMTAQSKPVLTGVTFCNTSYNGGKADHFVLITGGTGDGKYSFADPGTTTTEEAGSSSLVFAWDGEKIQCEFPANKRMTPEMGVKRYTVSIIRPNNETLPEWDAYWAAHKPGAAAVKP